ncbi:MAG: hypothetical protein KatS3mg022_2107 [Armatimonadota bacterium]|nr:MAG: hypothetical protein KatS3mg022_2107 [Armatimonadota bacterium]
MRRQGITCSLIKWAGSLLSTIILTVLSSAQQVVHPGLGSEALPFQQSPGLYGVWEILPPAPPLHYHTSVVHTRPEIASVARPVGPQYLREGRLMGSDGVVQGKRYILPFGTKGEKVALAFLSGDYVPPPGEKLQPALARLAQQRAAQLSAQASSTKPAVYALILLDGRLDEDLQAWLKERGVELLGFYPYSAYQARIPVDALNAVASHPQVRWVGQPNPVQKLDPELLYFMGGQTGERIWLYVNLFGADEGAKAAIASMVAETGMYDPSLGVFAIMADASTVNRLLDMDAVLFVEPIRPSRALHTESQGSISADLIWYYARDSNMWEGVKVGVMDTGLSFHWDFSNIWSNTAGYNRTTEANWWDDLHGHGTHVTGTFLGEGHAAARYRGTAQGLRDTGVPGYDLLISKVFRADESSEGPSVYLGLLDMGALDSQGFPTVYTRQVFNFSGGASGTNLVGTDANSRKVDELFRKSVLPVVAAGNDGPNRGTINSPGVAKGALTVGAIYDDDMGYVDTVASFSSRGPTGDWRRKPDVVAPGAWIDSCSNTDETGYKYNWRGTSMATSHVAGLAAGIIGQFGNYNLYAWVTKAIILANAINLGYPDDLGYGKVDAMLCHFDVDGWWSAWWGINHRTGDLQTVEFELPDDASLLRVVLVYPDTPAPSGASMALVNDLDLYLDGPTGSWTSLSPNDNVEVIELRSARAGTYRIGIYTYNHRDSSDPFQTWAVAVRAVYGPIYPDIMLSLSTPVAVRPYEAFGVFGTAYATSYVASGVYGQINLPPDITVAHMTFVRFAPGGMEESFSFPERVGINQGNIPAGFQRRLFWNVAAFNEGFFEIGYTVHSINGGTASTSNVVIVDGTAPSDWQNFTVTEISADGQYATCTVQVRDGLSGLETSHCLFTYSTDGGHTWSDYLLASITGDPGSRDSETMTASEVPLIPQGPTLIRFYAYDMAGNLGESPEFSFLVSSRQVSGTMDLQHFVGNPSGLQATIEIRETGSTIPLETHSVTLDSEARYTLQTRLHGMFDMAAKVSHWLRRTRTEIAIVDNISVHFYGLINGDVDNDNEVTLFDFGQLVAAFGSVPGDGNWNPEADLDGDQEVTLFDFGILVSNFGAIGDE